MINILPPIPLRDKQSDTWAATDGLGRALPDISQCGTPRPGKFVGLFYFVWLGFHDLELHDITQLLLEDPSAPAYGPEEMFHWWGEPRLGYYRSNDPFVIRMHARMLVEAGVDVIFLDVTNGFTYDQTVTTLCQVYAEMRTQGEPTPQIGFLLNSQSARVAEHLYSHVYAAGRHPDLWFWWQGKPLLLASQDGIENDAVRTFFTWRHSWAWANTDGWFGSGQDKWSWLDHYPQTPGWHENPARPEQISVNVAQHPISNIGRSFHAGTQPPPGAESTAAGLCFAEQWQRALEVDPEFVFVTGWNEWVAQRFLKQDNNDPPQEMLGRSLLPGDTYFVDQYNAEYSRDIEPMRGGFGDAYYYQMVDGIRRFKGVRPVPKAGPPQPIEVGKGFALWTDVRPEYSGDAAPLPARDYPGWADLRYVNRTARNTFDVLKVTHDPECVFFYARTHVPITQPEGDTWMLLLLRVRPDTEAQWQGFDFVVGRARTGEHNLLMEQSIGGGQWQPVAADVRYEVRDREMHLAVPQAALRLPPGPLRLEFKWTDNTVVPGDPLDWMDTGHCAPSGRFRFCYEE